MPVIVDVDPSGVSRSGRPLAGVLARRPPGCRIRHIHLSGVIVVKSVFECRSPDKEVHAKLQELNAAAVASSGSAATEQHLGSLGGRVWKSAAALCR